MDIRNNKSLLEEWLIYIQKINPKSIDLTLDRVREVAFSLNLLPFNIYTILVGGTNGKGSTCFLLEKILLNNKIKVGLYTSPHLLKYHERIRVCGTELSDDIHIQVFSMVEKARRNILLTYFEFITLSALCIFKRYQLDLVILEVGLGGKLDATNIIDPSISAITNIEIDHTDFLGNTYEKIAIEKSGIFRPNKTAIIGSINYPIIIDQIAELQGTKLFVRGKHWNFYYYSDQWSWISYKKNYMNLIGLPIPKIPIENAALALSILSCLPFPIDKFSIYYALFKITVLGRFQIVNRQPLVVLDVGHNPHAAIYTVNKLSSIISNKKVVRVVFGMVYNKDIKQTMSCFNKIVNLSWYCSTLDTHLSASIQQFFYHNLKIRVKFFNNILSAWKNAVIDSNENDCILVFGSFYSVQPILNLIIDCKKRYPNYFYKLDSFFKIFI